MRGKFPFSIVTVNSSVVEICLLDCAIRLIFQPWAESTQRAHTQHRIWPFFFTFLYSGHLKGLNFLKQGKKSPYVLWLLVKLGPKSDKLIFSKAFRRFGPRESNCSRAPKYWWIIKPTLDTTVKMSEKFKNGVKKNIQGVLRVTKADFTHWIRS